MWNRGIILCMKCTLCFGPNGQGRCEWCGQHRRGRKRWCSTACGIFYASNHHWATARQATLDRDGYRCQRCVHPQPLLRPEVHHLVPVGKLGYTHGCQHHQSNLITVCHDHHIEEDRFNRKVAAILDATPDRQVLVVEQLALPIAS